MLSYIQEGQTHVGREERMGETGPQLRLKEAKNKQPMREVDIH